MSDLAIRNWSKYQHYKNRPGMPWLKFYVSLLEDEAFHALPESTRLIGCLLLLVAQRRGNRLPNSAHWLAAEVHVPPAKARRALDELQALRFLVPSSESASETSSGTASESASAPAIALASPPAHPRTREEVEEKREEKSTSERKQQQTSKSKSTSAEVKREQEQKPEETAAAEPQVEAPREQRIREVVEALPGADHGSLRMVEALATLLPDHTFEACVERLEDRRATGNVANPVGLLITLLRTRATMKVDTARIPTDDNVKLLRALTPFEKVARMVEDLARIRPDDVEFFIDEECKARKLPAADRAALLELAAGRERGAA